MWAERLMPWEVSIVVIGTNVTDVCRPGISEGIGVERDCWRYAGRDTELGEARVKQSEEVWGEISVGGDKLVNDDGVTNVDIVEDDVEPG